MSNKGKTKAKSWCLVPKTLQVTKARSEKDGITSHLFKDKSGKVILFSGTNGVLNEKKALTYLKENKLGKKLKQIPIYPVDLKKIKK